MIAADRPVKGAWLLAFVASLLLYSFTVQHGAAWQDSGNYQYRMLTGDFVDFTGLARVHPTYLAMGYALARITPGDPYTWMNWLSSLGMALASANLAAVGMLVSGRRWIGLATAGIFTVAHTVWWLATIAEVYAWVAAGLTAEIWLVLLLLRRPTWRKLTALALVSGLGLGVHNFALLPLPFYVGLAVWLCATRRLPWHALLSAAAAYIVGSAPWWGMVLYYALQTGQWIDTVRSGLVGDFGDVITKRGYTRSLLIANLGIASFNFVSLLPVFAVIGWARMRARLGTAAAVLLVGITLIEFLFILRYPVPDQFTFLVPTLVMISIAAAVGIAALADAGPAWRKAAVVGCLLSILVPPGVYAAAPALLDVVGYQVSRRRTLPYRDEARYWLVPWKHNETSAERFGQEAIAQASPDGIIVADSTSESPPLLAKLRDAPASQVEVLYSPWYSGRRMRFATAEELRTYAGDRSVFLVSIAPGYGADALLLAADPEQVAGEVLYRLTWRPSGID